MKLENRTVLITGGTSGIGLELARQLLTRHNRVIVTGRDPLKIQSVAEQYTDLHVLQCDVRRPDEIQRLHSLIIAQFPTLDVLINNAGIMRNLKLTNPAGIEDISREIDVLLSGPIRMVQQFMAQLLAQRSAAIINVTSGLAFIPMPASPIYSAAKAALHAYTQSLRAQLAGSAIEVIELAPPPVETKLFREEFAEEMRGEKAMSPERLVAQAIASIEAGKSEITPGLARVLKIASRMAPGLMFKQMDKLGQPKQP